MALRNTIITEDVNLVGLEYLWEAVLVAPSRIVHKPIKLLKDVYTNLSTKLQHNQVRPVCTAIAVSNFFHVILYVVFLATAGMM